MTAPLTAKDFATDQEVRQRSGCGGYNVWKALLLTIAALVVTVSCAVAPLESETAAEIEAPATFLQADTVAEGSNESICLNGQNFKGCCSWKEGVKGYDGERLVCNNLTESPTCTVANRESLSGCCSYKDGFAYAESDGTVVCKNNDASPTCRFTFNRCAL